MKTKIRTVWVEGLCCVWERGGEKECLGSAIIIADCEGKPKKAVEIRNEMNGNHALIPVQGGDIIIIADQSRGVYYISICRMDTVVDGVEMQEMQLVDRFKDGEWKNDINIFLKPAVTAAMQKSSTLECTSPTYIKEA